jgi:beta-lactamase regulating signal transducer with metallopeptidase domain
MLNLIEFQWIITAIGWTILHSIWQITLVGILWFLINLSSKKAASSTKYFFSILAMVAIIIISGMTLFSELKSRYPVGNQVLSDEIGVKATESDLAADLSLPIQNGRVPIIEEPSATFLAEVQSREWFNPIVLKTLVILWLSGVLFLGLRFFLQWLGMRRLAHKGISSFKEIQLKGFKQLKSKIGITKSIIFLQSAMVASPMTFGHFKPIVLLPLGMINGFPPAQIEAIILHELAHIRRNDFLANAIQTWLEILFFYHPIVWIVSKRIRTVREELCDDEVIRVMSDRSDAANLNKSNRIKIDNREGSKHNRGTTIADHSTTDIKMLYAETLLNLQKYFFHNKNQLAMNAKGNKGELSHRIHRLFQPNHTLTRQKRNINAYLFGLVMVIALASFAFSKITNPTVSIAVDKMNVLYVGIDNPITIAVAGIPTEETKVESEQLNIQDQGNGHFMVKAKAPGKAIIKVTGEGHATQEFEFRVKNFPDPIARIGNYQGGNIDAERIMESEGIDAKLDCVEYDVQCAITGYSMTYVAKNEDPVESINQSGIHNEKTKELLQKAKAGVVYYFDNVKCKCPGDESERPINSMVFKIR